MQRQSCLRCHGHLQAKSVEHPYWNGSKLVALIEDVPSLVCETCGFQHFEENVESSLQTLVQDYIKMGTLFPIPKTSYRNLSS